MAKLCPDQTFLSLCHQRHVRHDAEHDDMFLDMLNSVRVRHNRAAAAAHPLEFEVSRCRTSQFARCFLPAQTRVRNNRPYTVFDTGTLDGFKRAVNRLLLP